MGVLDAPTAGAIGPAPVEDPLQQERQVVCRRPGPCRDGDLVQAAAASRSRGPVRAMNQFALAGIARIVHLRDARPETEALGDGGIDPDAVVVQGRQDARRPGGEIVAAARKATQWYRGSTPRHSSVRNSTPRLTIPGMLFGQSRC